MCPSEKPHTRTKVNFSASGFSMVVELKLLCNFNKIQQPLQSHAELLHIMGKKHLYHPTIYDYLTNGKSNASKLLYCLYTAV